MRRNNKQLTTQFILLGLLLIGVVYALLQANLQINGTAKIKANTWDIHFDNIVVNEDSVPIGSGDSPATIDPNNNCKVDFEVTLSLPGDFYEFTIDVVNAGTIDGMIGELTKTLIVNNELVENTPDYLDYIVTYSDGLEIEENHKINAETTETYLVRLEFKTDIVELPEAVTITTSLTPQYIQSDSNASTVYHYLSLFDVLKNETINNTGLVHEYSGEHKDSFMENGTQKIYHWYADNDENASIILNKWNVIFGGFCWQAYRTTDTGGVKLIYNGVSSNGKCNKAGSSRSIGKSSFNPNYDSLAYAGYKYGKVYSFAADSGNGWQYAPDVSYEEATGLYTLTSGAMPVNAIAGTDLKYRHYTCGNSTDTTCENVKYVYYVSGRSAYYITLTQGSKVDDAMKEMLEDNTTDSIIKQEIDTWYQNNMIEYTSILEDSIFCNDRSINNLGGWNPNGGETSTYLRFKSNTINTDLSCSKATDQFSVNNQNAQLTYPVGLMTASEARLLNNDKLRTLDANDYVASLLNSPNYIYMYYVYFSSISSNGSLGTTASHGSGYVRPVISLKPGTKYRYGDGSKDNPYIIEQ